MQDGNIEVSKAGFKFSYLRFLADGAAGLLLILVFTIGYYADLPIIGLKVEKTSEAQTFRGFFADKLDADGKILLVILLGLLAVPLGLMLNAVGWFLLGWIQRVGCSLWFDSGWFLTRGTREIFLKELLSRKVGMRKENLYNKAKLYDEFLTATNPTSLIHVQHIMGLQRLLRSLAIISFLASAYLIISDSVRLWLIFYGFLILFSLLLLSLLEHYVCLATVCRTYLLSLEQADVDGLALTEKDEVFESKAPALVPDNRDVDVLNRLLRRFALEDKLRTGKYAGQ